MSATIEVPRGLDKLDPAEQALFNSMRADDGRADPVLPDAPEAAETLSPDGNRSNDEGPWIDLDSSEYADVAPASREPSDYQRRVEAAEARARAAERTRETDAAVFQARLDMLAQIAATAPAAHAPPPAEAPIPDVNFDPIGHFREVSVRTQRQLEELGGIVRSQHENQQRVHQIGELRQWVADHEADFIKRDPTYRAAVQHLVDSRHAELEALGMTDRAARQRTITSDVQAIARKAREEGVNPAERFYNVAVQRGFAKAAKPASAPAAPAARTISAAPAARGAPLRLTAETIANMPDAQFEAIYGRLKTNPAALRQLMGH